MTADDSHPIEQIILNLATNARDAMAKEGRLTIRTWNESANAANYVGLSVTDTGHGMDEDPKTRRRALLHYKISAKGNRAGLSDLNVEEGLLASGSFRHHVN